MIIVFFNKIGASVSTRVTFYKKLHSIGVISVLFLKHISKVKKI